MENTNELSIDNQADELENAVNKALAYLSDLGYGKLMTQFAEDFYAEKYQNAGVWGDDVIASAAKRSASSSNVHGNITMYWLSQAAVSAVSAAMRVITVRTAPESSTMKSHHLMDGRYAMRTAANCLRNFTKEAVARTALDTDKCCGASPPYLWKAYLKRTLTERKRQ